MPGSARICIFGAGSIGCYVGGRLAAAGAYVSFIGRERIVRELREHGLHLTDWQGADVRVPPAKVRAGTTPSLAADADFVLVTVKSAATVEAAHALAPVLKDGAIVISFQNGLYNAETLRRYLPGRTVLTGMVQFNVLNRGQGRFHHGSEGGLEVEEHASLARVTAAFSAAGLPLQLRADMPSVLWGKLLLNLNNAINALCGVPLKEELSQRAYRRCLALAQEELLALLEFAAITPAKLTALPPALLPRALRLPDVVFRAAAKRMLAIDPLARSSMWEDLEAGRKTEVDYLNGEVVRLAGQLGRRAPVNAKLVELVHGAEAGGRRDWSGAELLAELEGATRTSA